MGNQTSGDNSVSSADLELEDFLNAAQKGDEQAFEMIWRSMNPRLSRFVAGRCYGTSLDYEEIVSEAWVSIARDISKFKGDALQFRSWVYTIARNRLVDSSRKRHRQVKNGGDVTELFIIDPLPQAIDLIESDEAVLAIVQKIKELPESQAEILLLRVVADLSVEETAKIVDKSENSVRVLCHRGLTTLREKMRKEVSEDE